MAYRIKDSDGNAFDILTEQESKECTKEPMQFHSVKEAEAFLEKLMATPEGEAQLRRLWAKLHHH